MPSLTSLSPFGIAVRDREQPVRQSDARPEFLDRIGSTTSTPTLLIFLLYAALLCGLTRVVPDCTNVHSRLLTMKMLVEKKTFCLDHAPFVPVDHVTIAGRHYSDKPPVLPAIGAVVYAGLHSAGYELYGDDPNQSEYRRERNHRFAVLVITFVLVGLSSAAAVAWFLRQLRWLPTDESSRIGLWLSFAFGTLFFSYSLELNNHVVGGACLWVAFGLVFLDRVGRQSDASLPCRYPAVLVMAGLLAGLALVIDPPAGGIFLPLLGWEVWRHSPSGVRSHLACFAAGFALPVSAHCVLQQMATGSVLPAQWYYPKYFPESLQAEAGPSDFLSRVPYTGKILFGYFGLFWMTPTLLFAPFGLCYLFRKGTSRERRAALATAMASGMLIIYYGFLAPANHGGEAYGFRWFIAVTPIWYYFSCVFYVHTKHRWIRWAFWGCACLAILAAMSGAHNPWLREHGNWWLIGKILA